MTYVSTIQLCEKLTQCDLRSSPQVKKTDKYKVMTKFELYILIHTHDTQFLMDIIETFSVCSVLDLQYM